MKVLVVGNGLIGKAIIKKLKHFKHEVIVASKTTGDIKVDLSDHDSIENMYQKTSKLDAVISVPGSCAKMGRPNEFNREEFEKSFQVKGFGQIDLVLSGQKYLSSNGSFTLTSGILSTHYPPLVSCISTINNAVEGFVKCASLELLEHLRLNVVSPGLIEEAVSKIGDYFKGFQTITLDDAVNAYIRSLEGVINGQVIKVWP